MRAKHILDTRGLMCPEPIRMAEGLLPKLAPGTTLTVLATDPASAIDFEAWCRQTGHIYHRCEDTGRWLEIHIQKSVD